MHRLTARSKKARHFMVELMGVYWKGLLMFSQKGVYGIDEVAVRPAEGDEPQTNVTE